MKLQSFLFSLLVLSMFCSQCLSASSCKMANWWGTFDHQGWSTCDSSAEYIKGLWRNHNYGDHEISLLEEAKCCSAPTPEENTPSICQDTDWSSVLDGWVFKSWRSFIGLPLTTNRKSTFAYVLTTLALILITSFQTQKIFKNFIVEREI